MGYLARFLVLAVIATFAHADISLKPGDQVPDLILPAVNGYAQRLEEVRGSYLMLIWLGRCDNCSELLHDYQQLAKSMEIDGAKAWVVWTPYKDDVPPNLLIPVLKYDAKWPDAWLFETRPSIMLIGRDGKLEHLITGNLNSIYKETETVFMRWISAGRGDETVE
ncbi:MAG: redoxin domain-containing protein [Oleibacter sp.]|nr:redoxin domain-containing protein [Thalassolituus sp.]